MATTTPLLRSTSDAQPPEDGGTPLAAVILGGAIVGASALLVIVVVALMVICLIRNRQRSRKVSLAREGRDQTSPGSPQRAVNHSEQQQVEQPSRPMYTQVFRQPPPIPSRTLESLQTNGSHLPQMRAQPRELLAYDLDIPETFKPFAPPPPVTGNSVAGIYDIPEAMYDDSPDFAIRDGYDMIKRVHMRGVSLEPSYDEVETLHGSLLTSSLPTDSPPSLSASTSFQSYKVSGKSGKQSPHYDRIYNEELEPSMLQHVVSPDGSELALPYHSIYDVPKSLRKSDTTLHISRQNIVEIQDLGVGHFGKVFLAATVGMSLKDLQLGENADTDRSILVAIKKLRSDADYELREAFENEIKFMSRMKHANVVRLLGACKSGDSFIMMEYMENGDLHEFLQKQKLVSDKNSSLQENEITPLILLYMTVQLASGMRYLTSQKFVHRDLAARNCLVGREFIVKISDFGMSRNLYESVYYRVQGRLILPIRWMAYESFYGKFSTKSDVWSFGITTWEMFTLCQFEPYYNLTDEEIIADAIKGEGRTVPTKPDICPKEVYDILARCWVHEPTMRADFEEVYSRLFLVYTKLSKQFSQ